MGNIEHELLCERCGKVIRINDVIKKAQQKWIKYMKKEFPITKHFDGDYFEFYNKQIKNRIKEMEREFRLD